MKLAELLPLNQLVNQVLQLTLRNFHTGGVAGNDDITQGLPRIQEIVEARNPKGRATITEVTGEVVSIEENPAERTKDITIKGETDTRTYTPSNYSTDESC